ncbi:MULTISPECIES: alpha/beta fold hydrolase [unclassified Rathayibacter]|jgi:pimeloyl-ACP methyl ester carboxylesterase|uniref:alpha/beta fold hydrolase n=1 Tax=unclassified Rathayibacter TaxID=2609250 RepID=UPI000CE76260|nr:MULTISPECIES: alpha/beta hydrolase [unclassified Rathayibacter]PPF13070.1 alpha/beta hydrolase [Rathayibacter sp. AY1A5]PPF48772.1 alpha/beta hydrolase [Rathayibacter sp. AY1A1]PPG85598.1 alpha/beta hydrolase [Rathayibacter sp. AY1H2]PPH01050.1 alpha/beta hydrolase [Rathayibacter sp. AY1G9]
MRLQTLITGSGPRHVGLVHGLGGSAATWGPLVERLVATGRHTVTAVDLRGHGESPRAESYRIDDMAADLVETLPAGLHSVVGHSLGGAVLQRAVAGLAPGRAVYLDPGFALSLPTSGLRGRLFWAAPLLSLGVAQLGQARASAAVRAAYSPEIRALLDDAKKRFDARMAVGVFRDVAFHPVPVEAPAVPSTVVLSDQSPAVLPDALAARFEQRGWQVRRLPGVHHDMQLEDPDGTFAAIADVL